MATGSPSGSLKLNKTAKSRAPVPHTIYVPAPSKTESLFHIFSRNEFFIVATGVLPPVQLENDDDFHVESHKSFTEAELEFQVETAPPQGNFPPPEKQTNSHSIFPNFRNIFSPTNSQSNFSLFQ
jgi:hypothetical protein